MSHSSNVRSIHQKGPAAESQQIIATRLNIKHTLMSALKAWMDEKQLTHAQAEALLGRSPEMMANVCHSNADAFTIEALVNMLLRAGKHIEFTVQ